MTDSSYWLAFVVVMSLVLLVGFLGNRGAKRSGHVAESKTYRPSASVAEKTFETFADKQAAIHDPSLIDADLTQEEKMALLEDEKEEEQ